MPDDLRQACLALIAAARGPQPARLIGADCGTFALAAVSMLRAYGHEASLCLVVHPDAVSVEKLLEESLEFYHVAFEINGLLYDGSGNVTEQELCLRVRHGVKPGILRGLPAFHDGCAVAVIKSGIKRSKSLSSFLDMMSSVPVPLGPALAGHEIALSDADISKRVRDHHHNKQDFYEGDLVDRLYRFSPYVLRRIDLACLDLHEFATGDETVQDYASLTTPAPAIVYDSVKHSIIDGLHRACAAAMRGEKEILAYVGTRENLAPHLKPKPRRVPSCLQQPWA